MLDQVKNKLFKLYLKFKYRPVRIKKHIRKSNKYKYKSRIMKENNFIYKESDIKMDENGRNSRCDERVTVAALQVKMELYDDPFKFADKMEELVVAACKKGAQLLVFPEDNLTQLLGLLPGIGVNDNGDIKADYEQSKINRSVNENIGGVINERDNEELEDSSSDINGLLSELGDDISVADILAYIGPIIRKISLAIFSELASKYGLYIMSGSGLFPEAIRDGKKADQQNDQNTVYNMAYLFGPDGSLLGRQKKNHLLPMEADWGLSTGEELSVIPTQIGRLAFPVCMDATYFETFQIACQKNVDIVMIPIANPDPDYNYWTALRGIWGRVQESPAYGIKSAMVGDFLGFKLTGQSGIYAPIPLTPDKSGIVSESDYHDKEDIITAELDLNSLREYRKNSFNEVNQEFEERYFPDIYNNIPR